MSRENDKICINVIKYGWYDETLIHFADKYRKICCFIGNNRIKSRIW